MQANYVYPYRWDTLWALQYIVFHIRQSCIQACDELVQMRVVETRGVGSIKKLGGGMGGGGFRGALFGNSKNFQDDHYLRKHTKIFPDISQFFPKITKYFRTYLYQNTKINAIINQRLLRQTAISTTFFT